MTPAASSPVPATTPGPDEIRRIILGVVLAMLLGALDQTIVATALPTIGAAFGDFASLAWVVTAYLLSCTVATPLYGKLSDIHGRRVMLLVAVAVFTFASVACALAPSLLALILARFVQGLGGGGLISLAQTIIADVVPPRERGRYQARIAGVFGAASLAGPVLGGFFAEHVHWSLIFWINLPLGLAAFAVTHRALRHLPRHERRHRMDYPGAALMMLAAVALLLALGWGGVRYAWSSAPILALLAGATVFFALFLWRMARAEEPFLPLGLLADPVVGRGIAAAFAAVGAMVGLSIYVPLYFETARGLSATQSGLALIPLMGGVVCGAMISGQAMPRMTRYKRPALAGTALAALLMGAIAALPATLPVWAVGLLFALVGAGIGTVLPVCTVSIQNAVPPHRMGTVTGIMTFFRQLGGALAVAVLGAVLVAAIGADRMADADALARMAAAPLIADAFRLVFAAVTLALVVTLGGLWSMPERPLRGAVHLPAEVSGA